MSRAELGDTVKVHYKGTLEDGTIFDDTHGRDPFTITLGKQQAVPGFEMGVVGMVVGETRTFTVGPDVGFGERKKENRETIKRSNLPDGLKPEVGMQLHVPHVDGSLLRVTVIQLDRDSVVVDTNHPLAGKALTFEVELLELEPGSDKE